MNTSREKSRRKKSERKGKEKEVQKWEKRPFFRYSLVNFLNIKVKLRNLLSKKE